MKGRELHHSVLHQRKLERMVCDMCGQPSKSSLCKICEHELARQQWEKEEEVYHWDHIDDPDALAKEQHLVALEELRNELGG